MFRVKFLIYPPSFRSEKNNFGWCEYKVEATKNLTAISKARKLHRKDYPRVCWIRCIKVEKI